MIGLENIPAKDPAIIVFYHSTFPNDFYYLMALLFLKHKRTFFTIIERIIYRIPSWSLMLNVLRLIPGSVDDCVNIINRGNLLALSPGGLREGLWIVCGLFFFVIFFSLKFSIAMFSDENYQLIWNNRHGFARIAKQTNVPIIPVFTQNSRESFRLLSIIPKWLCRLIYDRYKFPFLFIPYGGLPVKLTTFIGEPIHFTPEMTITEIAQLVITYINFNL